MVSIAVRREAQVWLAIVWPVLVTNLAQMLMGMTDLIFLGHYDKINNSTQHSINYTKYDATNVTAEKVSTLYLGAASLGNVWDSLMNVVIVKGINNAEIVLISSSLGARNFKLAKSWVYVCFFLITLCGIPIACSYIYAGNVLAYVTGSAKDLEHYTTIYIRILGIGFLPSLWYQTFNGFLVAQGITKPQMYLSMFAMLLNVVLNYAFLYGFGNYNKSSSINNSNSMLFKGIGFIGSPISTVISRTILAIGGFIIASQYWDEQIIQDTCDKKNEYEKYENNNNSSSERNSCNFNDSNYNKELLLNDDAKIRDKRFDTFIDEVHEITPTVERITFKRCKRMLLLALPLSFSMLLEDGQLSFVGILAARVGKVALATHNSMMNFFLVLSSMMWAITGATEVRISYHLGAGNKEGAYNVIKVASFVAGGIGLFITGFFWASKDIIGHLLSNDPHVWSLTTEISTLCGVCYLALCVFYISMATLTAQNRPFAIAGSFVIGAWAVCTPLCFFFAFHYKPTIGLFGLWMALAVGYAITTLLSFICVMKSDWDEIVKNIQENAEVAVDDGPGDDI
eukprot:g8289.t1